MPKVTPIIEYKEELNEMFWPKTEWHQNGRITVERAIEAVGIMRKLDDYVADLLKRQHRHTLSLVKLEKKDEGGNQINFGYNQACDDLEQLKEKLQ